MGIRKENNSYNNKACRVVARLQAPWLVLSVGQVFNITASFASPQFHVTPRVKFPGAFSDVLLAQAMPACETREGTPPSGFGMQA